MGDRSHNRTLIEVGLIMIVCAPILVCQEAETNVARSCIQPLPMIRWQDYQGPLQHEVEMLARKLDGPPSLPPRYKPGTVLCSVTAKDRFISFLHQTMDPMSFTSVGFDAMMDQISHRDPTFGLGSTGYAKRFAADFASQTSWRFLLGFAYPTLFSEDSRYYPLGHGSPTKRLLHAAEHVFVAHHDNGAPMFNYSEWLGTASAMALSDLYHPGNPRGFGSVAQRVSLVVIQDAGSDILKEFWPDIVRIAHIPFRDTRDSAALIANR